MVLESEKKGKEGGAGEGAEGLTCGPPDKEYQEEGYP
jgi:hypothetical protein